MTSTDAITLLKEDHKAVEQLFKRFENAGSRAYVEKRAIVDRISEALSVHASIEEQLFYPVVRATVPDTEQIALESLEEHHIVKWVLSELDAMSPEDERFDAKVTVLIENVRHHVKEEELEFFPIVRHELGRNSLSELGETMAAAKKTAPTHPHPRSPDAPPLNLVVGYPAALADRIGDTINGLAQGYVAAARDLAAVLLGRRKPQVSPTGSRTTRRTATQVRSGASDATKAAIEAVRSAKHALQTAEATGSSAVAGAKRTAGEAKRGSTITAEDAGAGVKAVATSAKRAARTTVRQARTAKKNTARTASRSISQTASTAARSTH